MKKDQITVGGLYFAKVSNRIVTVRVEQIEIDLYAQRPKTIYKVVNLNTDRRLEFHNAGRFRCRAGNTAEIISRIERIESKHNTATAAERQELGTLVRQLGPGMPKYPCPSYGNAANG